MICKPLILGLFPVIIRADCAEVGCLWVSPSGLAGIPKFLNSKRAQVRIMTGAKTVRLEVRE